MPTIQLSLRLLNSLHDALVLGLSRVTRSPDRIHLCPSIRALPECVFSTLVHSLVIMSPIILLNCT